MSREWKTTTVCLSRWRYSSAAAMRHKIPNSMHHKPRVWCNLAWIKPHRSNNDGSWQFGGPFQQTNAITVAQSQNRIRIVLMVSLQRRSRRTVFVVKSSNCISDFPIVDAVNDGDNDCDHHIDNCQACTFHSIHSMMLCARPDFPQISCDVLCCTNCTVIDD